MSSSGLLVDAFGRIREEVHGAVEGLTADQLTHRVEARANTIAWLVWHLTRVQDDHIADVAGTDQVWVTGGWAERFDLPFGVAATGYGHTDQDVALVRVPADLLIGYHDAVHEATIRYVRTLTDEDLPRIVDDSWDPPVSLGVRLVSVVDDDMQHTGQAAFVRGIIERA